MLVNARKPLSRYEIDDLEPLVLSPSVPAWRMNTAVSATVTGRVRISTKYAIGA